MAAPEPEQQEPPAYTVADVDRLTEHAGLLLDQLRGVLAEIGHRMELLTSDPGDGR